MSLRPNRLAGQPGLLCCIAPRLIPSAVIVFGFVSAATLASAKDQSKTETYDDGKPHFVYSVDSEGRKSGDFRELSPEGHILVTATYHKDQLNGPFKSLFPNGKPRIIAAYASGKLSGKYLEYNDSGELAISATYKTGELNGPRQLSAAEGAVTNELWKDGRLMSAVGAKHKQLHGWRRQWTADEIVTDEFWFGGKLLIPKGPLLIAQELAAIQKTPIETVGEFPKVSDKLAKTLRTPEFQALNEAGVRKLMEYRFLCDVPYKDMQLDRDYMAHAQAAAEILLTVGHLTHTPDNSGWPEDDYKFAYKGTTSSNIYGGSGDATAPGSVDGYMNDSDEGNIAVVGHRRWCINPAMLKTGFGVATNFSAMWSFDSSRSNPVDHSAVAFPSRGFVPSTHFRSDYAWSLSPNPQKFREPDSSVKVTVTPVRFDPDKLIVERNAKALEMEYFTISKEPVASSSCLVFRPRNVSVASWSAYVVNVSGLKSLTGQDVPVQYFVAFYDPAQIKPPARTTPERER